MNPKIKSFLIISAKSAVNAVITSTALTSLFHNWNQVAGHHGWIKALEAIGIAILSREAIVWGPKLLAWSNSSTSEDSQAAVAGGKQ